MSVQQFSQALVQERVFIVASQAYHPPEALLQIVESLKDSDRRLCLSLPYSTLMQNYDRLTELNVWKGLSDIPSMASHAFTSQVAVRFAKEAGIDFVVIGDSTARHVLYETDHSIATKLRGLLEADIPTVACFGETAQDYTRGATAEIIKEQLGTLLLGLTFEQIMRTILVYRAPWLNTIAPELFTEEHEKAHALVLDTLKLLFGEDIASHIPLLTDLPFIDEDFHKISYSVPPSGYFLELGGMRPQLVSGYFETLHTSSFGGPFLPLSHSKKDTAKTAETVSASTNAPTDTPEHPPKTKKSRKKKTEEDIVPEATAEETIEAEAAGEASDDTILFVDHELDPTIHFELNEPTVMEAGEGVEADSDEMEEPDMSMEEEFKLEWYSDEELEALRKEFGIQPDGTLELKPYPVWDNTRPVRVIKTQAQKAEEAAKPAKSKKKKSK